MVDAEQASTPDEGAAPAEAVVDAPAPAVRTDRRVSVLGIVAAVVIAGLVAALVVTQVQLADRNSLENDRASAVSAARGFAKDVATYDYRHLRRDFKKVERESTPAFQRNFRSTSSGLTATLEQYHAVATATVLDAGVVSLSGSRAVVILFVNQKVSNTNATGGVNTDDSRVRVTLVRGGSGWLLSDLRIV